MTDVKISRKLVAMVTLVILSLAACQPVRRLPEASLEEASMEEIFVASDALRTTLLRVSSEYPDLPQIDIIVTDATEPDSTPTAIPLVIIVKDIDPAEAEFHANQLADQGMSCENEGVDENGMESIRCES